MEDFKNWTEITQRIYRYVIAAGCCYEIHILYYSRGSDILTAKANLYLVGDWHNKRTGDNYFERECLMEHQPVFECLAAAVKDNEENNE